MHAISSITAIPIELPLLEVFETARRRANTSPTVLVKLTAGGITGWGEATPVRYVTGEDQDSVVKAAAKAGEVLGGRAIESYHNCSIKLAAAIPEAPAARAAVETAILDAAAKAVGLPLYLYLGGRAMTVETDITIPMVDPKSAAALARRAAKQGFSKLKIKVGGPDMGQDTERVLAASSAAENASLILDGNEGFEPDNAIAFVRDLLSRGISIEILEQPVPRGDLDGLKRVKEHVPVPVYADEAAHTAEDVIELIKREAVSGVVVKLMKAGPLGALAIASIARAAGLGLMMGTMLESPVGQSASLHIAAASGSFSNFDLDSDMLLADNPIRGGFSRSGSILTLSDRPGIGVAGIENLGR